MNGDGNVVRVKRWDKRQELEDELERQRLEREPESELVQQLAQEPESTELTAELEATPATQQSEASGSIRISYFSFLVCASMLAIFLIRGAVGFATDWLGK